MPVTWCLLVASLSAPVFSSATSPSVLAPHGTIACRRSTWKKACLFGIYFAFASPVRVAFGVDGKRIDAQILWRNFLKDNTFHQALHLTRTLVIISESSCMSRISMSTFSRRTLTCSGSAWKSALSRSVPSGLIGSCSRENNGQ